jgi:predicted GNAT family N-acyltransferase
MTRQDLKITIHVGDWRALGKDAAQVRIAVFVQEQGIAPEDEWDEADQTAVHAVAYDELGQAIGTGRLLRHDSETARIGRMAVQRALRGAHIGQHVLQALMDAARQAGYTQVMLYAQQSAEGFYQRQGFTPRGAYFDEVDIPHIEMFKLL